MSVEFEDLQLIIPKKNKVNIYKKWMDNLIDWTTTKLIIGWIGCHAIIHVTKLIKKKILYFSEEMNVKNKMMFSYNVRKQFSII